MYTHAHTINTTDYLVHLYVHTTCVFTQAHTGAGVHAYTKHVVMLASS